jgi:4-hydroxybenzoate polyprenyltransferase
MLLLQFAIGAANDWSDAELDALTRPAKPIPSGAVGRTTALVVAVVAAVGGLALAAVGGPAVATVGLLGFAVGLAYDLVLKDTAWTWLSFSAGFILLPLFAWLGGAQVAPSFLGWIVALALPAGASVSLANGLVDLEGDARVGRRGPAVRLGRGATVRLLLALHLVIVAGAVLSLALAGNVPAGAWLGLAAGAALEAAGWSMARAEPRGRRLLGWEVQALGLALLAGAWFLGMAFAG